MFFFILQNMTILSLYVFIFHLIFTQLHSNLLHRPSCTEVAASSPVRGSRAAVPFAWLVHTRQALAVARKLSSIAKPDIAGACPSAFATGFNHDDLPPHG